MFSQHPWWLIPAWHGPRPTAHGPRRASEAGRCSPSQDSHLSPEAGEDTEKTKNEGSLTTLNKQLPRDPAALLGFDPRERKTCAHTNPRARMFTEASSVRAPNPKEPRRSSTGDPLIRLRHTAPSRALRTRKRHKLWTHEQPGRILGELPG